MTHSETTEQGAAMRAMLHMVAQGSGNVFQPGDQLTAFLGE
ncbi:hypothetical protein [Streptomyces sp. NPDC046887]